MFDKTLGICRQEEDLDVFFPDEDNVYDKDRLKYAKSVCSRCPVKMECREEGDSLNAIGVWGGLTEGERRRIRKGTNRIGLSERSAKLFRGTTNAERKVLAAKSHMETYKRALKKYGAGMPQDFRLILETRINHPTLSLEEVGSIIGMSKDSVAGKLRRVQVAIESGKGLNWSRK